MRILYNNKKAFFDFDVIDKHEAGIVLEGWEVKSIKSGRVDLAGAFVILHQNELLLRGARVPTWISGDKKSPSQEQRDRRLLLHRNQIERITGQSSKSGYTIIPLSIYENDKGLIKVEIGLVKGKKKYDKRSKLKERDMVKRMREESSGYRV